MCFCSSGYCYYMLAWCFEALTKCRLQTWGCFPGGRSFCTRCRFHGHTDSEVRSWLPWSPGPRAASWERCPGRRRPRAWMERWQLAPLKLTAKAELLLMKRRVRCAKWFKCSCFTFKVRVTITQDWEGRQSCFIFCDIPQSSLWASPWTLLAYFYC